MIRSKNNKKTFFLKHKKSSALVITLALHGVFLAVALTFVVVDALKPAPVVFEAKQVHRPRPRLKKLQVPVKNSRVQAPKIRHTIVSRPKTSVTLNMPEISGLKGGFGYGKGSGLGEMNIGFELPDLFGGPRRGNENEFIGHFYDLKQTPERNLSEIGELATSGNRNNSDFKRAAALYREVLHDFIRSGWRDSGLKDYFKAPREKYATSFIIPEISAGEAPKAFGVDSQVEPRLWIAWYQGQIAAPADGKYRFVGFCDDYLFVRVKKDLVLEGSYRSITGWQSSDPDNRKYATCRGQHLVIGDWFPARKGESIPVDVMIGEEPGGRFHCQLYIQQEGVEYPTVTESRTDSKTKETITCERPILPIFKTADIPDKVLAQMKINPAWTTADGPCLGVEANATR